MGLSVRFSVFARDNFTCRYCGRKGEEARLEADHVVPLAEGGPDVPENLITACSECNRGKGAKTLAEHATNGDPLQLVKRLEEQKIVVGRIMESIRQRARLEQDLVNFWCEKTGRSVIDGSTFETVFSYVREFGVDEVQRWIANAAVKFGSDDDRMGKYVSSARRGQIAAILALLSRNGSRPIDLAEVATMVRDHDRAITTPAAPVISTG